MPERESPPTFADGPVGRDHVSGFEGAFRRSSRGDPGRGVGRLRPSRKPLSLSVDARRIVLVTGIGVGGMDVGRACMHGRPPLRLDPAAGPRVRRPRRHGERLDPSGRRWQGDFWPPHQGRGQAGAGSRAGENRRTAAPTSPESSEPASTPSFTSVSWAASAKARAPMNRLMVKPMPQSTETP